MVAFFAANGIFMNNGQTCFAPSRLFVQEATHDKLLAKLKKIAEDRVIGDPFDAKSTSGAIISKAQFEKVLDYIKSGKEEGAELVTGGERAGTKGYFVKPTIFTNVRDDMKIAREEVKNDLLHHFQ